MDFREAPDISFPKKPLGAPIMLRAALRFIVEQGVSGDEVLEAVGLSPEAIEQGDALLECGRIADAIEIGARMASLPDLGLRIGKTADPKGFGALGMMVLHASTTADALRDLGRYIHLINEATAVSVERKVNEYVVRVSCAHMGNYRPIRHTEAVCGALFTLCRALLGENWAPQRAVLAHSPVASIATYQEYWRCPVSFEAGASGFIARVDDLDRDLSSSNATVRRMTQDMLQQQQQARLVNIVIRAEALLRSMIPMGYTTIGDLANALGLTERTLQRRLGEQGSSFKQVLLNARREIVLRNLQKGKTNSADLCGPLGFSEASAVSRFLREHCADVWPSGGGNRKASPDGRAN
jgi:AraC-like DNA-binding protein